MVCKRVGIVGGILAAGVLSGVGGPRASGAEIDLPPYPRVATDTFTVDEGAIEADAEAYCAENPRGDAVDFYLGALPQGALDALCLAPDPDVAALLGDLYVSGYFGGLWLRDALLPSSQRIPLPLPAGVGEGARGPLLDAAVVKALGAAAGRAVERATAGGDREAVVATRAALAPLLYLYGYNLGYLQVLVAHPPPGMPAPVGSLSCGPELLDCQSDEVLLAVFDAYEPALSAIAQPDSPRWRRVAALVEANGASAVAEGAAVWEDILAEDDVAAEAYLPLVDVSVGFLMVTDAAVLAASTAWGEGDPEAARCALLLEAGLTVWSGSYFLGLASDDPPGTFPQLSCR